MIQPGPDTGPNPKTMPQKSPKNPNSALFEQAAIALASGERPGSIAARLGIDRKTLWLWAKKPEFIAAKNDAILATKIELQQRLQGLAVQALDVIEEIINEDANPARVRLSAACYLLDRVGVGDGLGKFDATYDTDANSIQKTQDQNARQLAAAREFLGPMGIEI